MAQDIAVDTLGDVLQRLPMATHLRDGPAAKRELVEALDCSRSTVDRGIRDLETLDLVTRADDGYALTPLGERVVRWTTGLLTEIAVARELQPALQWLPTEDFDLDLLLLADATCIVAEPGDPYAMVNRHVEVLEETDYARALLPLTGLHAHETSHERVVEAGARVELVVVPEVADVLRSTPKYVELTEAMAATGRFSLAVYDGSLPYGLCILDDVVQFLVDEDGEPRALLETDSATVRAWAEETYADYRQQATPVSPLPAGTRDRGDTTVG